MPTQIDCGEGWIISHCHESGKWHAVHTASGRIYGPFRGPIEAGFFATGRRRGAALALEILKRAGMPEGSSFLFPLAEALGSRFRLHEIVPCWFHPDKHPMCENCGAAEAALDKIPCEGKGGIGKETIERITGRMHAALKKEIADASVIVLETLKRNQELANFVARARELSRGWHGSDTPKNLENDTVRLLDDLAGAL